MDNPEGSFTSAAAEAARHGRQRQLKVGLPAERKQDQVWEERSLCQRSRRQRTTRRAVLRPPPPRLASRSAMMLL